MIKIKMVFTDLPYLLNTIFPLADIDCKCCYCKQFILFVIVGSILTFYNVQIYY